MNSFRLITYECTRDSTAVAKADIETAVITEVNGCTCKDLLFIWKVCILFVDSPPQKSVPLYLNGPQVNIPSLKYCEAHLVKYTTGKKLKTAYSISVLL